VIAIALPGAPSSPSLQFTIVTDGAQEAATAYLLFRRTLSDPGTTVLGEPPSHMEFLIDRFGYVRARWLPQEDGGGEGWRDTQFLLDQIERIIYSALFNLKYSNAPSCRGDGSNRHEKAVARCAA